MDRRWDQAACGLAAALGVLLCLSGCDRASPETAESRIPPVLQERFYPPTSWAWGRIEAPGAPPLRYGVATPTSAVRAEVLILPDEAEPAEVWFETVQDLTERDYGVWILDWAGQGGSGRWTGAPERLYAPSLDLDVAALRRMVTEVVRSRSRAPLILIGTGLGAQLALRALASGLPEVEGAALADPALTARPVRLSGPLGEARADWAAKLGLGRVLAPGERDWRAGPPRRPERADVAQAWMQANPALRAGGETWGWVAAYNRSVREARDPQALGRVSLPVLMLAAPEDKAAREACYALKACRFVSLPGRSPHLAADGVRKRWLTQVAGFVESRARDHVVAAAPVREGLRTARAP